MKKWTKEEIKFMIDNYPRMLNKDISILLKRTINSIQRKAQSLSLYKSHQFRSETARQLNSGKNCNWWKNGSRITKHGYKLLLIKNHPFTDRNDYIFEHRYVMEQSIGRYLTKNEVVHHINGDKLDNRIENLQLTTISEHTTFHNLQSKHSDKTKALMSEKARIRLKDKINHPLYKLIDVNHIIELRNQGYTVKNICEILGICNRTYYKKLKEKIDE